MKKTLLLLVMMLVVVSVKAADYSYLTFQTTDGSKVSVSVSGLNITISGTTLTAGSQSFTLSNLSKMYFSTSSETTAISEIMTTDLNEATEIYDLRGMQVTKDQMRRGVYIVKTKNGTFKVNVK